MSRVERGATGVKSDDGEPEDDMSCPVCFELFNDPCFVCLNHHTLCRGCYQVIAAKADARCPECRERLQTRPVENSRMRRLIQANRQTAGRPRRATCQAVSEDGSSCQGRAFQLCGHCDRDLCDLHFSKDRLEFQIMCRQLLLTAETKAGEAENREAVLTAWDRKIDDCIGLLIARKRQFRETKSAPATATSAALRTDAAALNSALRASDLQTAKAVYDRLAASAAYCDREAMQAESLQLPPAERASRLVIEKLDALVDEMERLFHVDVERAKVAPPEQPVKIKKLVSIDKDSNFLTEQSTMDSCTVQIFSVQFDESCRALANPDLDDTKCYVFFLLPGYASEETETPLSLPTPRPGRSRPKDFCLSFNFQKSFDFSFDSSYERRQLLALKLLEEHIEIPFTVVCEPTDPDSEFFQDLGRASVRLDDLIGRGDDVREGSFPLMLDNEKIGSVKVSTNLPSLLLEVYNEMPESKKASVRFVK